MVDRATALAAGVPEEFADLYLPLAPGVARIRNGAALDLGALESSAANASLSMQRIPSGEFKITLSGPAGNYRLDLSEDLKSWRESTTRKTTDGNLEFLLTSANTGYEFYRAVLLPQ